jgi:hypothetical protein
LPSKLQDGSGLVSIHHPSHPTLELHLETQGSCQESNANLRFLSFHSRVDCSRSARLMNFLESVRRTCLTMCPASSRTLHGWAAAALSSTGGWQHMRHSNCSFSKDAASTCVEQSGTLRFHGLLNFIPLMVIDIELQRSGQLFGF